VGAAGRRLAASSIAGPRAAWFRVTRNSRNGAAIGAEAVGVDFEPATETSVAGGTPRPQNPRQEAAFAASGEAG